MTPIAPVTALTLLVGAAMLLFGRRLFWLFVAGAGFVCGALVAADLFREASDSTLLLAAAAAGVIGAAFALLARKAAIVVGGFLAGGYLAHALAGEMTLPGPAWAAFPIGGVLGAVVLMLVFDWALIALSSLMGAAILAQHIHVASPWPAVLFVTFLIVGLAFQTRGYRRPKKRRRDRDDD